MATHRSFHKGRLLLGVSLFLRIFSLVVRSEYNNSGERQPRVLQKVQQIGNKVITEDLIKNNYILGYVPDSTTVVVEDYDPDDDIRSRITYEGKVMLNAWASDEDFDVAPRYVESYKGIKYASTYSRFARSVQAYGYTYTNFNITQEKGKQIRTIDLNATKYGPMCPQPDVDVDLMNENCLYLNIWRPSRWKQSLNKTTVCTQTFLGGGRFRKDCEIITTTRTVQPNGTVTWDVETDVSNKTIVMGGNYDKDGVLYEEKKKNRKPNRNKKKQTHRQQGRDLQGNLDNTLDNLNNALNDLNDLIEDSEDSEDDPIVPEEEEEEEEEEGGGTYARDRTGLLPVIFYVHGGGFLRGSGTDPLFDGSKIAGRGQVIVVTFNYRLGIFGFLPTFGWDQWKVNGGMNGFMDIVNALIWVNRNIHKWGGNPRKVTVVGPSSTPAVCLLTMCPLAKGKFQRAILTSSVRETEVVNGRMFTRNGVNGASCLTSEQEPYQPLEGRIEIAYKFFDWVNETLYNYPQNPNPSRQDLIDWLKSPGQNSTILMQMVNDENTVFMKQRPAAEFDYNRDGNITGTQQRRTFLTWDNDIFPRMPVDLEFINPVDMIIGVRGNRKDKGSDRPILIGPGNDEDKITIIKSSAIQSQSDNIFLRNRQKKRYLEDGNNNNTDDDFYVDYDEDAFPADIENETVCEDVLIDDNSTDTNETECKEKKFVFDFSGTTSDQDLCISRQFGEIANRNMKGNVYGYVFDDGTELHGFRRRRMLEDAIEETHRRLLIRPMFSTIPTYDYDEESLYFFDTVYFTGKNLGGEFVRMRKELFNRWINFAKTGEPKFSGRSEVESKKYALWTPFPKDEDAVGRDPSDHNMPSYLYMPAEPNGQLAEKKGQEKSRMIPFNELVTRRTQEKYQYSGMDMCSWVLDEENDNDGTFVDVLLDFNANTAFDYYVTVLATLNPTIEYVPDREYIANLPPTLTPTTIQQFVDNAIEKHSSAPTLGSASTFVAASAALAVLLSVFQ